ncbi:MAG TPA: type II secretion system protein [Kofleriaceae bacterium]|nr:type II secretion system protein [Kofleriaceae bacterium]
MRCREAGFTLLEMLVTVAVIGILAAIAIPSFFGETRKARAIAEVTPMFNDLRIRMEQYVQEHGVYPDTQGEGGLYPIANPDGALHALQPLPGNWTALNIRISGADEVRCGYTWVTSRSNNGATGPTAGNVGGIAQAAPFVFVAPTNDWYYLLAKCRMDPSHTDYSYYLTSSLDSTIAKSNEGQ